MKKLGEKMSIYAELYNTTTQNGHFIVIEEK
ncbi:hypothetical protein J2W57_002803 [Chryseobacterium ginsenosidimutans]|uniref:Uncharacterized protein n=1 Tax=Chryseobacterium geocarposphaerae TaxID=1416776 RepID=A0ABU1LHC5_9FLAO|nr:hypothetical protein [Chryseobacterium geocarposphaerae]MDR6699413.1 hypothetical protein [Chryseobacterium ginsenosidimutans]